ncbi:MAG: hypothetical protein ACFE85_00795 [Candidatus Hodarchaeota archaeon]
MVIDFLVEKPSPKNTNYLLIFSIVLLFLVYPFLTWLFLISYPVSFIESQLSFSGTAIKTFNSVANIDLYRFANILDYGFMVSYGGIFFSLGLKIARKFEKGSLWAKVSFILVSLAIIAPSCDAIENVFILLMLSDPLGFPDGWAITHSYFALVKYIVMFIGFGWIFVTIVKLIIIKISKKT